MTDADRPKEAGDGIARLGYEELQEMLVEEIKRRQHLERREQLAYTMIAETTKPKLRARELEALLRLARAWVADVRANEGFAPLRGPCRALVEEVERLIASRRDT